MWTKALVNLSQQLSTGSTASSGYLSANQDAIQLGANLFLNNLENNHALSMQKSSGYPLVLHSPSSYLFAVTSQGTVPLQTK